VRDLRSAAREDALEAKLQGKYNRVIDASTSALEEARARILSLEAQLKEAAEAMVLTPPPTPTLSSMIAPPGGGSLLSAELQVKTMERELEARREESESLHKQVVLLQAELKKEKSTVLIGTDEHRAPTSPPSSLAEPTATALLSTEVHGVAIKGSIDSTDERVQKSLSMELETQLRASRSENRHLRQALAKTEALLEAKASSDASWKKKAKANASILTQLSVDEKGRPIDGAELLSELKRRTEEVYRLINPHNPQNTKPQT